MSRCSRLELSFVFGRCSPLTVVATIRRPASSRTSSIIHKASFLLPRLPPYVYPLFQASRLFAARRQMPSSDALIVASPQRFMVSRIV
ncbi:hypothetical protein BDZ89DRAFT_264678 [Hymenopellis radicata]|nr:hypothetical protein BDZ89DRAFT_264678 [Hymenopellis radicata]